MDGFKNSALNRLYLYGHSFISFIEIFLAEEVINSHTISAS